MKFSMINDSIGGENMLLKQKSARGGSVLVVRNESRPPYRNILTGLIMTFVMLLAARPTCAQKPELTPDGEPEILGGQLSTGWGYWVSASKLTAYILHNDEKERSFFNVKKEVAYTPPPGLDILSAKVKRWGGSRAAGKLLLLVGNWNTKMVKVYDAQTNTVSDWGTISSLTLWDNIGGDAVYALSYSLFDVSRDSLGETWDVDTTGLGAVNFNDFSIDSSQYVYLATTGGIFKQHPDSSIWHKLVNYPDSYANTIYVDSLNRIYASTYYSSYMSSDGGLTWIPNGIGLLDGGITRFGEDAFHNIYGVGGGAVYRSDSGTGPWVRIDTSISNKIVDPITAYASPYNDVGGDTIIYLATNYGLFASSDQGGTWLEANNGIKASTLYGFLKSSGRQFITTSLGLFYQDEGDTIWTKAFPSNGYAVGNSIYVDNGGTLYTLGSIVNFNNSQSPNTNWKSTDNGTTWLPDTSGISAMSNGSIPKYLADEAGVQHYAVSGVPVECYLKTSGSPWTPDTTGLSKFPQNYPNTFFSDMRGNLYLAVTTTTDYTGMLFRRPIGGGTWVADTAGLQKAIVYSISVDPSGNLYAGTYGNGIYKRAGDTWVSLSSPGGLSSNDAFVTAVDNSGALWAGFSYQNGFNYVWQGVYYTTDDGGSWTMAGVDSISVRALIAYGDSVYAVTYNDGLYLLTKSTAVGIRQKSRVPNTFALYQNYPNPFNPSTVISYQLTVSSHVILKVYDVIGREVETLIDETEKSGEHRVTLNASRLSSGVYFYRVEAAGNDGQKFVSVKKLVLLR